MIRLFCKLKRITFHYFIFTLSLSFRQLAVFHHLASAHRSHVPTTPLLAVSSVSPPHSAVPLLCLNSSAHIVFLVIFTSQPQSGSRAWQIKHTTIAVSLSTHSLKNARVYARDIYKDNVATSWPIPIRGQSPHPTRPLAQPVSTRLALAMPSRAYYSDKKQASQWPCFKQALATNQPAAISTEKNGKGTFYNPSWTKRREKIWNY